jgi:nicotinamidase-related amidase
MGHKDLLVTHTLYRQRDYSDAHDAASAAPVHTSGVVLSTVRHAGDLDYRLVVVRDCCADPDAEVHAMLLDIVIAKQAAVVTTAEFAGALSGRSSCEVKSKESQ